MVNGRQKGNKAEREVCKILKEAFNDKFERRSMGMAGADIICPEWFQYAPEVKHHKRITCKHFWQPTKELLDHWEQAKEQAHDLKKRPVLFSKVEGQWFAVTHCDYDHITFDAGMKCKWDTDWVHIEPISSFTTRYLFSSKP